MPITYPLHEVKDNLAPGTDKKSPAARQKGKSDEKNS